MDFSSYRKLLFRRDRGVLHVTLNRPEQMNAFGDIMGPDVARFFDEIIHDDETRVVVISGAGKAFSAGGDIDRMQRMVDDPREFDKVSKRSMHIAFSMLRCQKPLIAKINGAATGLGCSIALLCDVTIAAAHAKIGDPHVKVGLVAGDGGALLWPQLVGYARAKQYLLTGDLLSAAEAERIGLINQCVPAEQLDATVDALAQRLGTGAGKSIGYTKTAINLRLLQLAQAIMPTAIALEDLTARAADHAEAVRAFTEKRQPIFEGC